MAPRIARLNDTLTWGVAPNQTSATVEVLVDDDDPFGSEVVTITGVQVAASGSAQVTGKLVLSNTQLTDIQNLKNTLVTEARQSITPG